MADDEASSDPDELPLPGATPVAVPAIAAAAQLSASQGEAAVRQVATALSSLAGAERLSTADGPDPASTPATSAPAQPGRIRPTVDGGREIVVKLDPEHLGSVSIRLRMTGGVVDVAITVSDGRTLDVLNRDRHVLSAAVSAAGLGNGGLTLAPGGADAAAPTPSSPSAGGTPGRSLDDGASASGDPSGGRRREPRPFPATTLDGSPNDSPSIPDAARGNGLYV